MLILGIESSCDDTAASVVQADGTVLSNIVSGQMDTHARFGGAVPEIAARAHMEAIDSVIHTALSDAKVDLNNISGFAATAGPGLIGGVMVGMVAAKTLAAYTGKPFYAVNHLVGHVLTPRFTNAVQFPYLSLLISGGHSQIVFVHSASQFTVLGTSMDDACGECLDKSAKIMGLPFPGGQFIDALARLSTNPHRFTLPVPLKKHDGCQFSFSGLKTAMRDLINTLADEHGTIPKADAQDASAALMNAVSDHLTDRLKNALTLCPSSPTALVVAGGVAASLVVRDKLAQLAQHHGLPFIAPPAVYCTDNAAMIAWAAHEHIATNGQPSALDFAARPKWPL